MKLSITIPRPPSVNGLYSQGQRGQQWHKTARAKAWFTEAGYAINPQIYPWNDPGLIPFAGPVKVLFMVNKKTADLQNLEKAPFDLMKDHGIYKDDSQVVEFTMRHDEQCGDLMFIEVEAT